MKILGAFALVLYLVSAELIPEEAAQVQVIDGDVNGQEGIFIKVNGEHRDNGQQVYMQVNLNVMIREGNVMVNDHILPFSELTTLQLTAQISEINDIGVAGDFGGAEVTVNFFLHEQVESEEGEVARAFRLETQIIETDQYDVHMFNVTEVVMELDTNQQEIRRTVTLISESESKLHAARNCPMFKCRAVAGCTAYKKDAAGCTTCECAAMELAPLLPGQDSECLKSCAGVCGDDPFTTVDDPVQDAHGCWICPCLVIDTFDAPPTFEDPPSCFFANKMVSKFEELPYSLRLVLITLLAVIAVILTFTCCATVWCRASVKENRKNNNLKAFGFGKLQIYVPDHEKKMPLIDNLDVVSADIA